MSHPQPRDLYAHPRDLVAEAIRVHGEHTVVDTCLALLAGEAEYDLLPVALTFLGGAGATAQLSRGDLVARGQEHWPRLWGIRGLRYVWQPYAEPAVVHALADPAWRVREMAAKVVAQRGCASAAWTLESLLIDEVLRVQVAAVRALAVVGQSEQAAMLDALETGEPSLQVALAAARRTLRLRLDRTERPGGHAERDGSEDDGTNSPAGSG